MSARDLPSFELVSGLPRARHYVDKQLQGLLILLMVAFQVTIISALLYHFYQQATAIYDASIYSIHKASIEETNAAFASLVIRITLIYLVLNLFGLVVADLIWVKMVRRVLSRLDQMIEFSRKLDFRIHRKIESEQQQDHPTLESAARWRQHERSKWGRVKHHIAELSKIEATRANVQQIKQDLAEIISQLKQRPDNT